MRRRTRLQREIPNLAVSFVDEVGDAKAVR
jgi:hypothetical protein